MTQVRSPLGLLLFSSWFLVIQTQLVIDQNDGLSVLDQLGLPNQPSKVRVVSLTLKKASHAANKAYVDTIACTDIAFDFIQDIDPTAPGFFLLTAQRVWCGTVSTPLEL